MGDTLVESPVQSLNSTEPDFISSILFIDSVISIEVVLLTVRYLDDLQSSKILLQVLVHRGKSLPRLAK